MRLGNCIKFTLAFIFCFISIKRAAQHTKHTTLGGWGKTAPQEVWCRLHIKHNEKTLPLTQGHFILMLVQIRDMVFLLQWLCTSPLHIKKPCSPVVIHKFFTNQDRVFIYGRCSDPHIFIHSCLGVKEYFTSLTQIVHGPRNLWLLLVW